MPITVLVVDDHAGYRACARRALEEEGYSVVGEAADCDAAVACAGDRRPQLALVDVHLGGPDGFEVADRLAALDDAPAVILISSHDRAEIEPFVAQSAARGFVPKDELSKEKIQELL